MMKQIDASGTPLAHYAAQFAMYFRVDVMWDEQAAASWIDPTLITRLLADGNFRSTTFDSFPSSTARPAVAAP